MKLLWAPPSPDDLIRLLRAWRFWFLGAIIGAVLGAAAYYIAPPPYRARATVNVDFHLEQAWPQNTDREQFYYLERETRKLEEVAMSDGVLDAVGAEIPGISVSQMRAGVLQLSQPGNGGWHFYANDPDPKVAAGLASAWARIFAVEVQREVALTSVGGLEPFITANAVQTEDVSAQRRMSVAVWLLAGAVMALAFVGFVALFIHGHR